VFAETDGLQYLNVEKIPSVDEELALEVILTQHEEIEMSVEHIGLLNFEDSSVSGREEYKNWTYFLAVCAQCASKVLSSSADVLTSLHGTL